MMLSSPRRRPTIASNNSPSSVGGEKRLWTLAWWLPVIFWAGVIFYMSTRTFGASFSNHLLADILSFAHIHLSRHAFYLVEFGTRKIGHFTEYAIFSLFLYHAISDGHRSVWNWKKALVCILLAGLYSLTDEFHQSFVPGRGPSIVDCGFDTIGAALGMVVLYLGGEGSRKTDENEPTPS